MTYKRPRNNTNMIKLKQQKIVTLPSGRTFITRYARKTKTNLSANVTIKRKRKRRRSRRRDQKRGGLGSIERIAFGFLKRLAKRDLGVSLGGKGLQYTQQM